MGMNDLFVGHRWQLLRIREANRSFYAQQNWRVARFSGYRGSWLLLVRIVVRFVGGVKIFVRKSDIQFDIGVVVPF